MSNSTISVSDGTCTFLYPATDSGVNRYVNIFKIVPTSNTVTIYSSAATRTNYGRKAYILGF